MQESASSKLRPLSMGEIFDRMIRLYRQNFLTFVGIVALVQIPLTLVQLVIGLYANSQVQTITDPTLGEFPVPNSTGAIVTGLLSLVVVLISFVLVQGLGTAALTRAVANSYLGQKTGILESYRQIKDSWGSLLGALIVAALIGIALFIWLIIPCIGWFTGPGIFSYYSWVIIPLIAPVIVLERHAASGAVRRIWGLVRQRFWPVFWFAILLILFNQLLIAGPTTLVNLVFQFGIGDSGLTGTPTTLQTVVQTVTQLIFSLLYLPLQLAGYTLLYFDLRVRLEGFDLAVLASEAVSEGEFDAVGTISAAPQGDSGNLITGGELGNFALISIAAIILYFMLVGIVGVVFSSLIGSPF